VAPLGAVQAAHAVRAALLAQDWQSGRPVTIISDGEPALPNLVCAAMGGTVRHILDWWHISMSVRWSREGANGLLQVRCAVLNGQDIPNFKR
jgi:hypothetical protein